MQSENIKPPPHGRRIVSGKKHINHKTYYIIIFSEKGSIMNTTSKKPAMTPVKSEPTKLLRRIGSTTYTVTIHHSNTSKDTMADIVRRIIEREVDKNA